MPARRGSAGDFTILVENLGPVVRGFRRASKETGKTVRESLKRVVEPVAELARSFAVGQRLVHSGELVGRIRAFANTNEAGIRETATRAPTSGERGHSRYAGEDFSYPSVYEFGGRGAGEAIGPRAFMYSAAERGAPLVEIALADSLMSDLEQHAEG